MLSMILWGAAATWGGSSVLALVLLGMDERAHRRRISTAICGERQDEASTTGDEGPLDESAYIDCAPSYTPATEMYNLA